MVPLLLHFYYLMLVILLKLYKNTPEFKLMPLFSGVLSLFTQINDPSRVHRLWRF